MRVFTATLGTETNTFSPIPTGMSVFKDTFLHGPGEHPDYPYLVTGPLWALRQRAKERNWQVVEGTCAFAQPAGPTVRKVYEELRDRILEELKAALPVDMVLLGMHGAMVADGYDDCEGDLLEHVRVIVGPKVIIGGELDLHCHITEQMLTNANALVAYKEYPHTDFLERGFELVDICADAALKRTNPVMSMFDCRMFAIFHTPIEPMRSFVDKIQALEGKDGILSVSVGHGFPWGDVADMGTKIVVISDGDRARGDALAAQLGGELRTLRDKGTPPMLSMDEALDQAMQIDGTVVLADTADNPGGGAPCDSTFLLEKILRRGIANVALGPIWDPIAVNFCFDAGEGATLKLRVGGKVAPVSGQPLDLEVTVLKLTRDSTQSFGKARGTVGDVVALRCRGVDLILNSKRGQATGADLFTAHGISLADKKLIVVKSSQHFYAAFAPLARKVLYTTGPGSLSLDWATMPFKKLRRPIWPLDENAF